MAGTTMAGEIYKYVDENGEVHYGDRPTGDPAEQRMALVSRGTNSSAVNARIDQRRERDAARDEARQLRENEEQEAAAQRADADERAAKCEENRARLRSYDEARRLYKEDDNGERVYLDESERAEAEARVRDMITEYCG